MRSFWYTLVVSPRIRMVLEQLNSRIMQSPFYWHPIPIPVDPSVTD